MKWLIFCVILIGSGLVANSGKPAPPNKCYTQWFDRDDPKGTGDDESLDSLTKQFPGQICCWPKGIEAQTIDGVPAENTGQVFTHYDTQNGFLCLNSDQSARKCSDYKVRFVCSCPWP